MTERPVAPRRRIARLLVPAVVLVGLHVAGAEPAAAGTARLHVIDFNACDQRLTGHSNWNCNNKSPDQRADAIAASVADFTANVVILQEVCQSTYLRLKAALGSPWGGYFKHTYVATDGRCLTASSTSTYWGIAVLTKASLSAVENTFLYHESSGELRHMTCGNTTIGSGFRVCTTHLSNHSANAGQLVDITEELNPWVDGGAAVMLGGDLNMNVRTCSTTSPLKPIHYGWFGGSYSDCTVGTGRFLEADRWQTTGDGTYNEATHGSSKIDFILFNPQRFDSWSGAFGADAGDSTVSDHRVLRGAMTVHD